MISRSLIIKIVVLLVTLAGICFSMRIELGEDALDMLPGTSLQGDFKLLQQLGMVNRIFISLELPSAPDPDPVPDSGLLASARALGEDLSLSPLFAEVFYQLPEGYQFRLAAELRQYLPVLADDGDLRRFEALMAPEVLREKLAEAFQALNSPAGLAMKRQIQGDPLGFTSVILEKLSTLRGALRLNIHDGFFISNDGRHCLIWAESAIPLTVSGNAVLVNQRLEEALARSLKERVTARIVGPLPHTLANAGTIRSDLARLLPVAIVALVTFLLLFLRDRRALLLVAIPFLAAPPAVALLAGFYGKVSAMALGFGIVLLGIGVDFAVHIYLGARGIHSTGKISGDLRGSLFMAFFTTIAVFAVLLLSSVAAHRQMALLGIIGLSWAFVLAWLLAPPLGAQSGVFTPNGPLFVKEMRLFGQGSHQRWLKLTIWLLLLAAGLSVWPSLRYNGDLRALDVPVQAVSDDERAFKGIWGGEGEQAFVVAVGREQDTVLNLNDRVYQTLARQEKSSGVQSLAVLLPGPDRQVENLARWREFQKTGLAGFERELRQAAIATGFTPAAFQPFLDWLESEPESLAPGDFLDGPLRPFIYSLFREFSEKGAIGKGESVETFLAATIVPDNPDNKAVLERLSSEIAGVTVLSNSRWRRQVEEDLKRDIVKLSTVAALLVIMICALFFRSPRPVLGVLAPVTSALAAMALFAAFTGGELNIMHALMGIMVIGLSVDYGIFMVRACLGGIDHRTLSAVSICAVSTLSGFGVLGFAEHPALHALGVTVLVGIGAAWPTALLVTPALLASSGNREEKP
ncbi:MAG: hypothetical protein RQ753_07360 [Desulfurivibrionaceae bacterium]|nr:hypothetical protein [Desulfurivibrionaceae bacterium]